MKLGVLLDWILMDRLLEQGNFPAEKNNINLLLEDVKRGNIGISLSSFEDIYDMTPKGKPFPVGCIKFEDGKKRFVISWIDSFSKLGLKSVEEYSLRIRNYTTRSYPVLSMLVGLHNGMVDKDTKEDLWYYGDNSLDIAFMTTRIKMYQLLNCDEILFCLFDEKAENLDSYGFSLNKKELEEIGKEVDSVLNYWDQINPESHITKFTKASKVVEECFTSKGLPRKQDALQIYLNRKSVEPTPTKHNWLEYLSI